MYTLISIILFLGILLSILVEAFEIKLDIVNNKLLIWYNDCQDKRKYVKL